MSKKEKIVVEIPEYEPDYQFAFYHNIGKAHFADHWHQAIEIIMPVNKSITVDLNTDIYHLDERDILIIPSGHLHMLRSDEEDGGRIILQFDLQLLSNIQGLVNISYVYAEPRLITFKEKPRLHRYVHELLLNMLDEYLKKEVNYEANIVCKILDMSVYLTRDRQEASADYGNHLNRIKNASKLNKCLDFIKSNYKEDISYEMAADAIGFSKYYFTRWFKQHIGMSFTDYLYKIRIEKAESMLLFSSLPVTEIAFESGFQSIETFNRSFKKYTNYSPREYRRLHHIRKTNEAETQDGGEEENEEMEKSRISIMKIPPDINSPDALPGSARLNGDGTFTNPFIWADVPDPDVIRVGDIYYMVSTTMYFSPHCPIMKSYDLVNWEIVNYTCDILEDSDISCLRRGKHAYGKGSWAASIRWNKGTFYVTTASFSAKKTYIFQTEDIENGRWRRYEIDNVYHDQSLLFDDDGRVYLSSGTGQIHLLELNKDATAHKEGGINQIIIENTEVGGTGGLPAEGSHLYKINGYYYIFLISWPPTGSGRRIQLCYRAKSILGPYEGRVVLDDDLGFQNKGVAQGGIVDTPDGDWYAMLFQDHEAVGRIPVLVPLTWEDGWPVFGKSGSVPEKMALPNLSGLKSSIVSSDEFYEGERSYNYTAANDSLYLYRNLSGEPISNSGAEDKEILENNYFKDGADGWEATSSAALSIVSDEELKKDVLKISGRAVTGAGPKQDLAGKLIEGGVYEVSARIKYTEGAEEKRFFISIFKGESWETIQNMGTGLLKVGEWGTVSGTYTLPLHQPLSNPYIFIETSWTEKPRKHDDLMDFYVESVSVKEKPLLRKVKTSAFENDPNDARLNPVWQWNHNPDHNLWSLKERPGYLRLKSGYLCNELTDARNTLTQRSFGPVSIATVALDTSGMKDGDYAGFAALQDRYGYVGIKVVNGAKSIIMVNTSSGRTEEEESIPLTKDVIYLRIDFNFENADDLAHFYYSEDEIHWYGIGTALLMKYDLKHFTGYRFALFYYSTQLIGGYADFDYFRISASSHEENEDLVILNACQHWGRGRSMEGEDSGVQIPGIPGVTFALPVRMDAFSDAMLPQKDSIRGIYMSFKIPELLKVEDVIINSDNVIGKAAYEFDAQCLKISATGNQVWFRHGLSDVFAMVYLKVKGFALKDEILKISPDYIHIKGGNAVYKTNDTSVDIRLTALETNAKAKLLGYANPLISHKYGADPWALSYGGRIYLYLTGDAYEYNERGKLKDNTYGLINTLNLISSEDMLNWTDHGAIPVAGPDGAAKWAVHSWAPAVACKKISGKDRFFLYFANDASNIGVLTADSPTGPWTDPVGGPLIHRGISGVKDVVWCFDPAVLVDDDGSAYLYFGGGLPSNKLEDALHPRTARVIKLGSDMISTEGEAVLIDAPALFEDAGINKLNGKYYFSYCSNFVGEHPPDYPQHGEIAYMVSDSPMGPFTYVDVVLKNPEYFFDTHGNNHHCIFTFKDKWYIAYHTQTLGKALGKMKGYRSPHINALDITPDGRLRPVAADMEGIYPESMSAVHTLDPYKKTEAETFAWQAGINTALIPGGSGLCVTDIQDGDWIAVANLDFGAEGAKSLNARLASATGGEIEIRLGSPEGELAGTLGLGTTGGYETWKDFSCDLNPIIGIRNIFFVFKGDNEKNLFNFDYWKFGR